MSEKRYQYQNGLPRYEGDPYVQNEGLYVQFNPFVTTFVNYDPPAPKRRDVCIMLRQDHGNRLCTDRQSTQMCRSVITDNGPVCAGYGATVNLQTGATSKACTL